VDELKSDQVTVTQLAGSSGRVARCRIEASGDSGWDVVVEIDDRVVWTTHCSDWHRVERVRDALNRSWGRLERLPPP
jgi:hypothetical protein